MCNQIFVHQTNNTFKIGTVRKHTGELALKECCGERLTVLDPKRVELLRGVVLTRGDVLRKVSLRGSGLDPRPDRVGSTGTAPGSPIPDFFLLEGGISEAGKLVGIGSFSMARYTRCMAYKMQSQTDYYKQRKHMFVYFVDIFNQLLASQK